LWPIPTLFSGPVLGEQVNYECKECSQCPLKAQCTQAKGNRKIRISFRLLEYRRQARANLTSEESQRLRANRSTEVETVFGNVKQNMGFRRFHLRGMQKVKTEWGIVSIAHNMRKLAANRPPIFLPCSFLSFFRFFEAARRFFPDSPLLHEWVN
jgi:ABC-2 type transport system ATP-binding protein/transposase